jgi:ATP-binding cassette subfamily B multidrug efflux pump
MKLIFSHLKNYKYRVSIALILKSVAAFADLIIPFLIAYMIDKQIPSILASNTMNYTPIYYNGALMVLFALAGFVMNVYANRLSEFTAAKISETIREDLFKSIFELSQTQVDDISKPSLISRMTTDTYNIYRATAVIQRLGIRAPILLLGGIILSFTLDPVLTLVLIAMLPFVTWIVYYGSKKGIPLYAKNQELMDQLIRKLREFIQGSRVVRALSMHDHEMHAFYQINKESNEAELYANKVMAIINPVMMIMLNVGLVVVLVLGAIRVQNGLTEIGAIMAFITYFTIILNAMMGITRIFVLSSRASASSERIIRVLSQKDDMVEGDALFETTQEHKKHIEFSHVSFSYLGITNQLNDISFTLYKGQSLGIIGPTGSGKTTLVKLLNRFYDPTSGIIKIYNKDIKSYKKQSLRQHMSTVLQHDMIFNDTIAFNISLDHETPPDQNVIETAQAQFVFDKEEKLDSILTTHGTNVSGGQKQRILISRALQTHADIFIFDDATSALDYQTEQKFREALEKQFPDTTKIIIAQRIAAIKHCDLILFMEHGKITASGTHTELLETSLNYKMISDHQLGGEVL